MRSDVESGDRGRRAPRVGALACMLVVLLLAGHDLRPLLEPGHEHSSGSVAGLCFLILSVLVPLVVAAIPPRRASVVPDLSTAPLLLTSALPVRGGDARASPDWLQRFRN